MIDQARHAAAQFAGLHGLLRGAGQALLPLHGKRIALAGGKRLRLWGTGGVCVRFCLWRFSAATFFVCGLARAFVRLWRWWLGVVLITALPTLSVVVGMLIEGFFLVSSLMYG